MVERDEEHQDDLLFRPSSFAWKKPARAADSVYPGGFGPVPIRVQIARWSSTHGLMDSLGVDANAGSVPVEVMGSGVDLEEAMQLLPSAVEIFDNGRILAALGEQTGGIEGEIDRETGLVSGRVNVVVNGRSRRVSFKGAFLQPHISGDQATVGGGFLLFPPTEKGGATRSIELRFGR